MRLPAALILLALAAAAAPADAHRRNATAIHAARRLAPKQGAAKKAPAKQSECVQALRAAWALAPVQCFERSCR